MEAEPSLSLMLLRMALTRLVAKDAIENEQMATKASSSPHKAPEARDGLLKVRTSCGLEAG